MKILAIAKVDPRTSLEEMKPHLEAEVKQAWKLYKDGAFREMYNRQDRPLGVVFVLECSSTDEARSILEELPLVRERLIDFEVIPLSPFTHFEALFKGDHQPAQRG
jgi:hypothetical protein